jgi:transposase
MDAKSKPRRRHTEQFKAQVLAACAEAGASVAQVARRFDLNDNLVHQWRRGRGASVLPANRTLQNEAAASFVTLSLPAPPQPTPTAPAAPLARDEGIRIEIKRGGTAVSVIWPVTASADCAVWLSELLR